MYSHAPDIMYKRMTDYIHWHKKSFMQWEW